MLSCGVDGICSSGEGWPVFRYTKVLGACRAERRLGSKGPSQKLLHWFAITWSAGPNPGPSGVEVEATLHSKPYILNPKPL